MGILTLATYLFIGGEFKLLNSVCGEYLFITIGATTIFQAEKN